MKRIQAGTVFLLILISLLCFVPAQAQRQAGTRISVKYLDGKPKSRGRMLTVSDSGFQLRVRVVNPARRADPGGRHKAYLFDTLTVYAAEMERMRVGPKSKKRIMRLTTFGLMGVGLVGGFVAGAQTDFGVFGGAVVGSFFGSAGLLSGISLGLILNRTVKKKYVINGSLDKYRAIVPELQGHRR
ncbi:MAG: hypothetical protein MUD08_01535 [Cytophagales bacterium]|jgi:hypothetical protein|nr:hypothetical protein [Cytophagales bacterium]